MYLFSVIGWHLIILILLLLGNAGVWKLSRADAAPRVLTTVSWVITAFVFERVMSIVILLIRIYADTPANVLYWTIASNVVKLFLAGGLLRLTTYSLSEPIKRWLRRVLMGVLE